jgi:hypothetical protein
MQSEFKQMYKELGKAKNCKRIIVPSIILFGFFSLPVSAFFIYVAIESMEFKTIVIASIIIFSVFLFSLIHVKNIYTFPPIEIDRYFLVVNQPFQKRTVYTIKNITWAKPFLKALIMVHNGVPALINLNSLSKEEIEELINLIAANKVHHNGAV